MKRCQQIDLENILNTRELCLLNIYFTYCTVLISLKVPVLYISPRLYKNLKLATDLVQMTRKSASDKNYTPVAEEVRKDGKFASKPSAICSFNSTDPDKMISLSTGLYYLQVWSAWPWLSMVLLVRALIGSEDVTLVMVRHYHMCAGGRFVCKKENDKPPGCIPDSLSGANHFCQVYFEAESDWKVWFTAQVVWEAKYSKVAKVVNNERLRAQCQV